jgi:hypothetical protein
VLTDLYSIESTTTTFMLPSLTAPHCITSHFDYSKLEYTTYNTRKRGADKRIQTRMVICHLNKLTVVPTISVVVT